MSVRTRVAPVKFGGRRYVASEEAVRLMQDDLAQRVIFREATTFGGFIQYWRFMDGETGKIRVLGESLWSGQRQYVDALLANSHTFALKGRQVGLTTIAVCFAGWVARMRDPGARVHCLSTGDQHSQELLEQIRFGLEGLPPVLQIPMTYTAHLVKLQGGAQVRSYPSTPRSASRGTTTSCLILDEWAAQVDPRRVFQAASPTVSPTGSMLILTTSQGANSFPSMYYRSCMSGGGKHVPVFVSSLERPDRTPEWYSRMQKEVDARTLAQEYPTTWEEALSAGGTYVFDAKALDGVKEIAGGLQPARKEHRYAIGVDLGKQRDATVIVCVDYTFGDIDVASYTYLKGADYVRQGREIERVYREYNKPTLVVEANSIGDAVCDHLDVPAIRFTTSRPSKNKIISDLAVMLQKREVGWIPEECPELDAEMRGYEWEDENIPQDTVLALALAVHGASLPPPRQPGKLLKPFLV